MKRRKNRIIAWIAAAAMALSMTPSVAFADSSSAFAGGSGTESDPYVIRTAEQLAAVAGDLDAYYVLDSDIDLSSYGAWMPLGEFENTNGDGETPDESKAFSGVFDGKGHKITGINIDGMMAAGLFGVTAGAEIKDLSLENVSVKGTCMVLGWIVNIGRSIPFIILIVAIMPFTRMIVGSATGVRGAIVPLIVAAAPFVARLIETSLMEVDEGLIEVAHATGSTIPQIVFKVMLPESKPSILMGIPITLITLIGYSAMAGAVGAGGLGDIALRYGYYRYQDAVMLATVVLIVILVQIIQSVGTIIAKKTDRRIRK